MESTVAQKLEALLKLQQIDSELDNLKKVRGDLPEEVRDLEDEIAGYKTRIEKQAGKIKDFEKNISDNKSSIKEAEKLIKKYEDQQANVRNNREYDAITKEMELQQLDIEIFEKKIRELGYSIDKVKNEVTITEEKLADREKDLINKKEELNSIISESEEEEKKLAKKSDDVKKGVEERLLYSYDRLRNNLRNGLAVVKVARNACGGCFNTVPPQRQAEIKDKKKIIICEHCGRILADVEFVAEPEPKPRSRARKTKAAKTE